MRLMFPKDDSDKNKLDMPPYAQPLLAPFVPKIKMFTFRNFMDIESEINDCSEVTIQIILAKMLCSCSEEVGKGGMASSPRSLCYLGTAFHKFTRGCEQEGYGRHSASRSRGTVNAPLTPPALTEHYASSSVILIWAEQKLSQGPNPGHGSFSFIATVFLKSGSFALKCRVWVSLATLGHHSPWPCVLAWTQAPPQDKTHQLSTLPLIRLTPPPSSGLMFSPAWPAGIYVWDPWIVCWDSHMPSRI